MTLEELETNPGAVRKAHDNVAAAKAKLAAANTAITETSTRLIRAKEALMAIDTQGYTGQDGESFYAFHARRDVIMNELANAQTACEMAERDFERAKQAPLAK